MKKIILSLSLAIGLATTAFAQPELVTGPAISLDKDTHDYGDIAFDSNGACQFKVTNTGNEPLIISGCQGSCGCTVPKDWSREPLAPGASGKFSVKFNGSGANKVTKTITVTANTEKGSEVVKITAFVKPDPTITK